MPIYAYQCAACGFEKDALQKIADAPLRDCPQCNEPSLQKKLTAAGFALKGSGWYATDFKGSGSSAPSKAASDNPSASAGASASCGANCGHTHH